jgi:choline kinase
MTSGHAKTEEIHLVLGYKEDLFREIFGSSYHGIPIMYHVNDRYQSTHNLYSLFVAREAMKDDILFMTADLIIDPELVRKFMDEEPGNKALIGPRQDMLGTDAVKVVTQNSRVINLLKNVHIASEDDAAVGLYRLDTQGKDEFFATTDRLYELEGIGAHFVEEIPIRMADSAYPFSTSSYPGHAWFDVDDPEDFLRAQRKVPQLYHNLS